MRTIEIPTERWLSFLTQLDRNVAGHAVRLDVENMELGDVEMAHLLPLQGLDLDLNSSNVEIQVGEPEHLLSHRIEQPARMYAIVSDEDEVSCLCIEDGDGGKTLMFFEKLPALPASAPHLEQAEQHAGF
jgi:hypothetical protein